MMCRGHNKLKIVVYEYIPLYIINTLKFAPKAQIFWDYCGIANVGNKRKRNFRTYVPGRQPIM